MIKLLDIIRSFLPNFDNLSAISSISNFGPGWLFGILATVAISLFSLSIGRTRAVISLLSIYVAFVIDRIFPYFKEVDKIIGGSVEEYWLRIGAFLASYAIVFFVFNFSFIRKKLSSIDYSFFGIMILSVLQLGFIGSIMFNMFPRPLALEWSFGFYNYIATSTALFFWTIAPLPILLFIRK